MPRPPTPPTYRLHRPTGQAVVTLRLADGSRKDFYLGRHGSPGSRKEYARLVAEAASPAAPPPTRGPGRDVTVNEVLAAFKRFAEGYYVQDGEPTTEVKEFAAAARAVRELHGHLPAGEFGPRALAAVRQAMVVAGLSRKLINKRVGRVVRVFRWAASEELVPEGVYRAIKTLPGLKAGKTKARETDPVGPVPVGDYEAALPYLPRVPRAMAQLQRWTGMRSGEVCRLRLCEIDRSGPVWIYRPGKHKTRHRGKTRVVPIGPRGQAALLAFLAGRTPAPAGVEAFDLADPAARQTVADLFERAGRPVDAALLRDVGRPVELVGGSVLDPAEFVFSPARDRAERFAALRLGRKTRVPPSQMNRTKRDPERRPGACFRPHPYATAVRRACGKAGAAHWHPNQLRHLFATEVRKAHGIEAAQVVLGHARADVTQVYAERDEALAASVVARVG